MLDTLWIWCPKMIFATLASPEDFEIICVVNMGIQKRKCKTSFSDRVLMNKQTTEEYPPIFY